LNGEYKTVDNRGNISVLLNIDECDL